MSISPGLVIQNVAKSNDKLILKDDAQLKLIARKTLVNMPYGSCFMAGNALESVINTSGIYVKVAGVMQSGDTNLMTGLPSFELEYNGLDDAHFLIMAGLTAFATSNNQTVSFKMVKNGVPFGVPFSTKIGTAIQGFSILSDITLSTDDTVDIFVSNISGTANVTVQDLSFYAHGTPV